MVTVAGRVMLLRDQGKLAFAELRDSSGAIQLFVLSKVVDDFAGFTGLDLGDWIGATGEVVKTRRGELSIKLAHLDAARQGRAELRRQVARHQRPRPPLPPALRRPVGQRGEPGGLPGPVDRSCRSTRRWLEDRDFVEVETPVFHPISGGAHARPFTTHHNALDTELSLRIAPELYLKRLVVGGFERVFEIARVFRNEGLSTRHNPEFTMLELYQAYADYSDVMELTEQLVAHLATELHGTTDADLPGARPRPRQPRGAGHR